MVGLRTVPYGRFIGLDTVSDIGTMSEKYLYSISNMYVDFIGQINRMDSLTPVSDQPSKLVGVESFGADDAVMFGVNAAGTGLDAKSLAGKFLANAFSGLTPPHMTQFSKSIVANVAGQAALVYDGTGFVQNTNIPQGGTNATILKRLAVAGIPGQDTLIKISKLDNFNDYTAATTPVANDGTEIDIKNELIAKDKIKALAVFEDNKLAVFCQNQSILYQASLDITQYTRIRDFQIPFGTIGKNTIKRVGTDLFFASKVGVMSLRRAASGLTLETLTMSRRVQELYDTLVARIPDDKEPTAVWNPDKGQYHLFFPRAGNVWDRLTFTYEPGAGRVGHQSWSFTENVDMTSASYYAGELLVGQYNGSLNRWNSKTGSTVGSFRTPLLFQGDPLRRKSYKRLAVRVSGNAAFTIKAYNELGRLIQQTTHQVTAQTPFNPNVPEVTPKVLDIKFEHLALGVSLEFNINGSGSFKLLDFAVTLI